MAGPIGIHCRTSQLTPDPITNHVLTCNGRRLFSTFYLPCRLLQVFFSCPPPPLSLSLSVLSDGCAVHNRSDPLSAQLRLHRQGARMRQGLELPRRLRRVVLRQRHDTRYATKPNGKQKNKDQPSLSLFSYFFTVSPDLDAKLYWFGLISPRYSTTACQFTETQPSKPPLALSGGQCKKLPNPKDGYVTGTGTAYGSTAVVSCYSPYVYQGQALRTCQIDGTWSGAGGKCSRKANRFL